MNSINKKEIEKFSKIAEEWWNPEGKFKPLHKFNPIRISYIKNNIISSLKLKNDDGVADDTPYHFLSTIYTSFVLRLSKLD